MNPFRNTIVGSPWDSNSVDVPEIHGNILSECLGVLDHIRQHGRSAGLLIHGEAGSGKTHLLQQLRARLAPHQPTATDRHESLYVWVRLQTSPRMIWRTVRRTLVNDWFRPIDNGRSQFDRILFHRLAEIRIAEGDLEPWYEYMREEDPDGLAGLMNDIADHLFLDRNTAVAFMHIAFDRHRRDLRAWLAGDSLPQAALQRMDLAQDEGTDEEREDQARQVVLMLCRLAGNGLPIVLSFDQVEALELTPGDRDAMFLFGQLISTLHDGTTNVLLISSVQSSFATRLKDHARDADYDRLTSLGAFSLHPLSRAQAECLISARLKAIGVASPGPACWPLDSESFEKLFTAGGVAPRQLLNRCADAWQTSQQMDSSPPVALPALRPDLGQFLGERWDTVVNEKISANGPEITEDIIRHGVPLLVSLVSSESKSKTDELLPDVSVILDHPIGRVGVSVCTQPNMTSLASRLKRLKLQFAKRRLQRLVVIRDSRVPVSEGAKIARQCLTELEQQGAVILHPSVEVLAALDALRALLSDAKSGDLDCHGQLVTPRTVEDWLRSHLSADLQIFADDLLGRSRAVAPVSTETQLVESVSALLAGHPLLPLDEAAAKLNCSGSLLVELAQRYPEQFGLLGQPTAAIFRCENVGESLC